MTTLQLPDGRNVPARRRNVKRGRITAIADGARDLVKLVDGYYMDQQRTAIYEWQEPDQQTRRGDEDNAAERKPGCYVELPMPGGVPVVDGSVFITPDRGQRASERTLYPVRLTKRPQQGVQEVSEAELSTGDAWAKWGGIPNTRPRDRQLYADLVKAQIDAFQIPVLQAVDATGLHQEAASGHWYFMLPDGRTLEDPAHPIGIPSPLAGYRMQPRHARAWADQMPQLPQMPQDAPTEDDVIVSLFNPYQELAPQGHLFITTGAAFRALVCSLVPAETTLIGEGDPEAGKTLSQKHARAVVGPSPYQAEADTQFTATATRMEAAVAPLADVPALVDNFRIQPDATAAELKQVKDAMDRIILSGYSGEEMRGRGKRDGSAQQGRSVRTLVLMNGEQIPASILVSTLRRAMVLVYRKASPDYPAGDLNIEGLKEALPTMDATLTRWGHATLRALLEAVNQDAEALCERIRAQEERFSGLLLEHARSMTVTHDATLYHSVVSSWARVLTGWWLAEWALRLPQDEDGHGLFVDACLPHARRHMGAQLLRMAGVNRGEDGLTPFARLALRLAERIRDNELIGSQTWRLLDLEAAKHGERKPPAVTDLGQDFWGWHEDSDTRTPVTAGYVSATDGTVYLLPKMLEHLRKQAIQHDDCASLRTDKGLWQAALAEGWIVRRGSSRHHGVQLDPANKLGRCWALSLERWTGGSDPDADTDTAANDQPTTQGRYSL